MVVASIAHTIRAKIDFDDLQWERRRYERVASYGQSKLANLMFGYELQRRLAAAKAKTIAVAAHPGISATELVRHVPGSSLPGANTIYGLLFNTSELARCPPCGPPPTDGPRRAVLRTRWFPGVARLPEAGGLEQAVARPRDPAAAVGGVRGVDRRDVPGLMRSVSEHQQVVAGLIAARPPVRVGLAEAEGLVLAADVDAPLSLPVFDNSAMDGYAVRAEDVASADADHPVRLPVAEDIPAGRTDQLTLAPGTTHRIMTGARCRPGPTRSSRWRRPMPAPRRWRSAPRPARASTSGGPVRT